MSNKSINLFFIHGWGCRASDWEATCDYLADAKPHIKTHRLTLPGHPEYSGNKTASTILELANYVASQLKVIPGTWLLAGHSMGGCVALEAAAQLKHNPQLQEIILVDTFGLPYGDMDQQTIDSVETPFIENFVSAMEYLVDNTTSSIINPDTRLWIKRRMSSANPELMLPVWHDLLRWSPDNAFQNIHCPIYALNGEHIPIAANIRCAPYVQSQVLEGCHHFPQFEHPALFFKQLEGLLP